jgi:hypothetical protein
MTTWHPTKDKRIKRRDGVYWARFMKKGKRIEVSLDTRSFEAAKNKADTIENKIAVGKSWKLERQLFKEAWTEFLIAKKIGDKVEAVREKTLFEYAAFGVRYYLPFFGEMRLGDIDEHTWRDFVEHVQQNHGGVKFFNIKKYFSGFMTWAKVHGKVPDSALPA